MIEYKRYVGKVIDLEDGVLHGRVINIRDVVTFEAKSAKELEREFRKSVDVYIEMCEKHGEDPDRPFSGRFVLRLEPELHRRLYALSQVQETSINTAAVQAIKAELERSEL